MDWSEEDTELFNSVVTTVMNYTGVDYDDLIYSHNKRSVVSSRRVIALILREHGWSYPKIGKGLKKDHGSIYNLINRSSNKVIAEAQSLKERLIVGHKPAYKPPPDMSWQDHAACKDTPTEVFFDVQYKKRAFALCSKCPVQDDCLNYRFETLNAPDEDAGIWGNTTPAERFRMQNS